jgi:hypothetical protein
MFSMGSTMPDVQWAEVAYRHERFTCGARALREARSLARSARRRVRAR